MWPTADELRVLLGAPDWTADDYNRAHLLLELAVGLVEGEARQPLSESTDTLTVDGSGTAVLVLPRRPVSDVSEVTIGETTVEGYTWSPAGLLHRTSGVWPYGLANIAVTVTAGFGAVPRDLWKVVLSSAKRGWTIPEGIRQESLGDHSITYDGNTVNLSDPELSIVRRYQASVPR